MQTVVVLDANVYSETNYGRSGKFSSLTDYLRKSNFRMVVLASVLEEVLAKFEREGTAQVEKAKNAVKNAAAYYFSGKRPVLLPADFSKEKEVLKDNLLHPVKGVEVVYVPDCLDVDTLEMSGAARDVCPQQIRMAKNSGMSSTG
jgi:hypothetical protein